MIDISKGRYWDLPWSIVSDYGLCLPERLDIPLKRRKPTVYAVWNDLFHAAVDPEFSFEAFEVMRNSQRHTFLVLTKRPQNISRKYFEIMERCLKNVCLGLTVCNQPEADEKIPIFLQVPGKKALNIEPMLGEIDLRKINTRPFPPYGFQSDNVLQHPSQIHAVILGGETGPGARPLNLEWVRSVRDQCQASGTPFFFKGWGEWAPPSQVSAEIIIPMIDAGAKFDPDSGIVRRFGHKRTGRLLDGRTHDDLPWRPEGTIK